MEMKLNSNLIKELRLARSWTQEQLAQKARLNPRTIQRVEIDGRGSLRTRALLATALGVSPAELDLREEEPAGAVHAAGWRGALKTFAAQTNLHDLTIQLLVSLLFLASAPAYFSWSRVAFSWVNISLGRPSWAQVGWWWVAAISLWALVGLAAMAWAWRRRRTWLPGLGAVLLLTLTLSILHLWQRALVAELLTTAVFLAGLALLVCQWVPRWPVAPARHLLHGSLFVYVYLWLFQPLTYAMASMIYRSIYRGGVDPGDILFLGYRMLAGLDNLFQLLPVLCVLLLARGQRSGNTSHPRPPTAQDGAVQADVSIGQFHERQLLEN